MAKLTLNTASSPFDVELSGNCLIAGRTGSGKTVLINDFIKQLNDDPEVEVTVIDAKGYEYTDICERLCINRYTGDIATDALANVLCAAINPERKEQVIIIDEYQAIDDHSYFSMLDQMLEMNEYGIHIIMASQGVTPEVAYDIEQFDLRIVFDCMENVRSKVFMDFYPLHTFGNDFHYLVYRASTKSVADCKQEGPRHDK